MLSKKIQLDATVCSLIYFTAKFLVNKYENFPSRSVTTYN